MGKEKDRLAQQVDDLEREVASLELELATALRMVVTLLDHCGDERLRQIDLMMTDAELDSLLKIFRTEDGGGCGGDAQRLVPERGEPHGVPGRDALHAPGAVGPVRVSVPWPRQR